ncbi:MAG: HEPN domain-containing protein [Desulfuromonadales bacterium]|nr:MAG: HEPN domain-containing protein [Desulfuromonadales bacterium]
MTAREKQIELARYRLCQARETLEEAVYLLAGDKSPRSVINRAYYSMFYAILALLVFEPFSSSKHSGVISYFNKRFIKEGVLPERLGRSVNKAFELRQRGDYREYAELTRGQVEPFIGETEEFLTGIQCYLDEHVFRHPE